MGGYLGEEETHVRNRLLLILVLLLVMVGLFVAAPVLADSTGWGQPGETGNATGDGPPGWSQVSRGNGGSGTPGTGPLVP